MARKISGRIKRAITSSLILFSVAGVLAVANVYTQNRDRQAALGPEGPAQRKFFVEAVERPDITAFFKRFTSKEKVQTAMNLRRYRDPAIIKLATLWLTDFDANARKELDAVLVDLASEFPTELAAQLDKTGGFQKLGVAKALRSSFDETIRDVINQLDVAAARSNTVEYLAASGKAVGPYILPKLASEDKATRLAAADALGKVGYQPAGDQIRRLYWEAETTDQPAYLAALANLGDGGSEPIFRRILESSESSTGDRASSILGLGRIGSTSAIALLAGELEKDPLDRGQIIEALSLAGVRSLGAKMATQNRLEVAGGIREERADDIIAVAINDPSFTERAAELAVNRPDLADALAQRLSAMNPMKDGRTIEILVAALASTSPGRKHLAHPTIEQKFGGFISREMALARSD